MTAASIRLKRSAVIGSITNWQDAEPDVEFSHVTRINPDLTSGVNLDDAIPLLANNGIFSQGVQLYGNGFVLQADEAAQIQKRATDARGHSVVRKYMNGKDLARQSRGAFVIDFFGMSESEARSHNPAAFQWVHDRVKPERDQNRRATIRENWWRFGWERPVLRKAIAGLRRFIVTPETAKHRFFVFLDAEYLPDNMLSCVATSDPYYLGVLSSRVHKTWALAVGGTLEDRPRYTKVRCFDPFPFPQFGSSASTAISACAEQLDAHRKRQQAAHPKLTLTDMYNVLEKLRAGEALTAKERVIHDQGLVSVLRQIHDDLDAAVFAAYGWPAELSDEQILERLVALNAERAAEEARGVIRWLRPEFQAPQAGAKQTELDLPDEPETEPAKSPAKGKRKPAPKTAKPAWPKEPALRTKAVQEALSASGTPLEPEQIAKQFARGNTSQVIEILDALCSLGLARRSRGKYSRA
jgi:hypothetical protein